MKGAENIKKTVSLFLSLLLSVGIFCVPASAEDEYPSADLENTDISANITLGEYKNLDVTVNVYVTDDELDEIARENGVTLTRDAAAIPENGRVVVSYAATSRKNGTALLNGQITGGIGLLDGTSLVILGAAVDIKSAQVGTEMSVDITVPAGYYTSGDYSSEEIEATVSLTVSHILAGGSNNLNNFSDYETYRTECIKNNLKSYDSTKTEAVIAAVMKNSAIVDYLKVQMDFHYNNMLSYYENVYNSYYSTRYSSVIEMMEQLYSITTAELTEYAQVNTAEELMLFSVYKAEGFAITDSEYNTILAQIAAANSTTSAALTESNGDRFNLKNEIIKRYTAAKLVELNNVITDYDQYSSLVSTETSGVTTPGDAAGEGEPGGGNIDAQTVAIIVVLVLGAIVCAVLLVNNRGSRVKEPIDYGTGVYGAADETDEADGENGAADETDGDNKDDKEEK